MFSSGISTEGMFWFPLGSPQTESFDFLWAFHKQKAFFTPGISTDRKFYVLFCVVHRQKVISFPLGSLAVRISLLSEPLLLCQDLCSHSQDL